MYNDDVPFMDTPRTSEAEISAEPIETPLLGLSNTPLSNSAGLQVKGENLKNFISTL